jgi:predicted nucleotidyltransferase
MLAERIWFSYKQLDNAQLKDTVARAIDYLAIILEKNEAPVESHSAYTFDFGIEELMKMVCIPEDKTRSIMAALEKKTKISISGKKLHTSDIQEILKLSDYYKKMQERENTQKKNIHR